MAKKRGAAHGGGHGWFVTFADLMGLLVAFFVMLVAFSTQDQVKLQIVAGSMRDAFGVQDRIRYSGVIEVPGLPTRPKLKNAAPIQILPAARLPTDPLFRLVKPGLTSATTGWSFFSMSESSAPRTVTLVSICG